MDTSLKNILFLDIETVSGTHHYQELPSRLQEAWKKKAQQLDPACSDHSIAFFDKAAIYAEFGKVIVIGIGYFHENAQKELCLRVKSISSENEHEVLSQFCDLVGKGFKAHEVILCAHNGKEFDFPYLCRRMLVNGIKLPEYLRISGKKPWDIKHLDTMELWKFGDRKSYSSLELLASVFNIPSSKQGIDGSKVNTTYYHEQKLEVIAEYCRQDVAVLAQLYLKMHGFEIPLPHNIHLV